MKKIILVCSVVLSCATSVFAQLNVNSNGNVAVKTDAVPISTVSINGAGRSEVDLYVSAKNTGIRSEVMALPDASWGIGVTGGVAAFPSKYNVGIQGFAYNITPLGGGRAYGVQGQAGNCTSGYNWGVCGLLNGSVYGAGIYGSSVASDYGDYVPGRYAGYFRGDVCVTGNIYGQILTSSALSVRNVEPLTRASGVTNETVTDKLSLLNTVRYNLNLPSTRAASGIVTDADTLTTLPAPASEELQAYSKNHYGFVAEELRTVYPDLVYENSQGGLSINYIEMIPLLVQSIKELTSEVESLKAGKSKTREADENDAIGDGLDTMLPELYQNNPNPFSENTEIKYSLPKSVNTASLYIYDMNGKQIDEIALAARGEGSVIIQGNRLTAGMYLYSLIADGEVISVKRMILTK